MATIPLFLEWQGTSGASGDEPVSPPAAPPRRPWRRAALMEIIGCLAIFWVLDRFVAQGALHRWSPHPLWAIVLLASVQYGSREGIFAGLAAAAVAIPAGAPEFIFGESQLSALTEVAIQPLLWILAAVVLGGMVDRRVRAEEIAQEQRRFAREAVRVLARDRQRCRGQNIEMQRHIAGQANGVAEVIRSFQRFLPWQSLAPITSLNPLVLGAIPGCSQYSIFLLIQGELRLCYSHGWQSGGQYAPSYRQNSLLFSHIVREKTVLEAAAPVDRAVLGDQGIVAGPLIDPDDKVVFGMLKIEQIDFHQLQPSTVQAFRALCELLGSFQPFFGAHLNSFPRFQDFTPLPALTETAPIEDSKPEPAVA